MFLRFLQINRLDQVNLLRGLLISCVAGNLTECLDTFCTVITRGSLALFKGTYINCWTWWLSPSCSRWSQCQGNKWKKVGHQKLLKKVETRAPKTWKHETEPEISGSGQVRFNHYVSGSDFWGLKPEEPEKFRSGQVWQAAKLEPDS